MTKQWAREAAKARKALDRNRRLIESTATGTSGARKPGGRTRRKAEGRLQ